MATTIHAPRVRIVCDDLPAHTDVARLDGHEAIQQLYSYELLIVIPGTGGIDPSEIIGCTAAIVLESNVDQGERSVELRRIPGIIASCEDLLNDNDFRSYRLRLVPRLWKSTLVETLEVYQEMSVPDIIKSKLEALHLVEGSDFELRLDGTYPAREFVVQYKETDFAFISRLCEHLGISFFFETKDEVDLVVFTDSSWGFQAIGDGEVPFQSRGEKGGVFELVREAQVVPSYFVQRDYNYRNPGTDLLAQDSFDGFGGGVVEYGGHFKDPDEGKALAILRREERECRQLVYRGRAADPQLSAGHRVSITGHSYGDIEVLPVDVHYRCVQPSRTGEAKAEAFHSRFEATSAGLSFRPERKTPRPRIQGVLTGIVDSAGPGQYADIDDWGRYRVRFMFDTSGPQEGKASRLVRMMQPHSGGGYGMHFPLRRGIEVLITFLGGDPDRPIIAGTVPNPATPSPVAAGNSVRNVLRTGGGNEMNIEDTTGSERIKFTVPHASTVFQLGAPNLAESGAALQTVGAWTASATSGTTLLTSFQASMSALTSWRSSGNIVAEAKPPSALTVLLAGGELLKAAVGIAQAALAGTKSTIDALEKGSLQDGVAAQDVASKKLEDCKECQKKLKELEAGLPEPYRSNSKTSRQHRQAANDTYADAMDKRRVRDKAREASVGHWTDQNEVAQIRRAKAKGDQYDKKLGEAKTELAEADTLQNELALQLDAASFDPELSADDQAAIAAYRAELDACRQKCAGLIDSQNRADKALDEYHQLRQDNGGTHKFIASAETAIGAAAAALSGASALVSTYMAIAAMAKKCTAAATLTGKWLGLKKATVTAQSGRGRLKFTAPSAASIPLHSLGALGSTHLYGKDVLISGDAVGIFGTGGGSVVVGADKETAVTAGEHVYLTAGNSIVGTADLVDIYAKNGQGKIVLKAENDALIATENKGMTLQVQAASQKLLIEAGKGGGDPKLELQSDGSGTVTLKTHDWKMQADDKGFYLGKGAKGEIELRDKSATVRKDKTKIVLKDNKGTLKSKEWAIEGEGAAVHVKKRKVVVESLAVMNMTKNVGFAKVGKFSVAASKVDLG